MNPNPGWLSAIITSIVAVIGAGMTIGIMKASASALSEGQRSTQSALSELTKVVQTLAMGAAVNQAQHEELARRLLSVEHTLDKHEDQLGDLRTKAQVASNKLMELDRKGYLKSEE